MSDLRRHLLGVSGVIFVLLALLLAMSPWGSGTGRFTIGALIRAGLLLIALWLALPSVIALYKHFPKWVWIGSSIVLLAAVVQGRITIIVAAVFGVVIALQVLGRVLRPNPSASDKKSGQRQTKSTSTKSG